MSVIVRNRRRARLDAIGPAAHVQRIGFCGGDATPGPFRLVDVDSGSQLFLQHKTADIVDKVWMYSIRHIPGGGRYRTWRDYSPAGEWKLKGPIVRGSAGDFCTKCSAISWPNWSDESSVRCCLIRSRRPGGRAETGGSGREIWIGPFGCGTDCIRNGCGGGSRFLWDVCCCLFDSANCIVSLTWDRNKLLLTSDNRLHVMPALLQQISAAV